MKIKKNRLKKQVHGLEAKVVIDAFKRHEWRLIRTAESLGVAPSTLQSIIKRNTKIDEAYEKHGFKRGRPKKHRKSA